MAYSDIFDYFREKIPQAGPFKETSKPFDQSIPSSIIDRSFSIVLDRISGVNRNEIDFLSIASVYINLYRKGFISESKAREYAIIDSEAIIKECMKVVNANTQPAIKNVKMRSIDIIGLESNDNTVLCRINFDVNIRMNPNS